MGNDRAMKAFVSYVKDYMKNRFSHAFEKDELITIAVEMNYILLNWTGHTYVGRKKDCDMEKFYQDFFVCIHKFLKYCEKNSEKLSEMEKSFAEKVMYRGIVYRYLGKSDSRNYSLAVICQDEKS